MTYFAISNESLDFDHRINKKKTLKIFLSKAILSNGGQITVGLTQNSSGDARDNMLNDFLHNNRLANTSVTAQLMNNEELKSYTQPLLTNTSQTAIYPSSIVAPNIQVKPSDALFTQQPGRIASKQQQQQQLLLISQQPQSQSPPPLALNSQPLNFAELMKQLKETENIQNGTVMAGSEEGATAATTTTAGAITAEQQQQQPQPSDLYTPSRLKSTDIGLVEKISVGQFSTVWKGRCLAKHNETDGGELDYAVKVFGANQKSSWANEKDIYNLLSTANEFILRYYGSDVNEKGKTTIKISH
jgi:hypothetical protein